MDMPKIFDCDAKECAYNNDMQCHAMAINVGGKEPICDTFLKSSTKGGIKDIIGGVGACKVQSCTYNDNFECSAQGIHIKLQGGHADCSTYKPK